MASSAIPFSLAQESRFKFSEVPTFSCATSKLTKLQ